MRNRLGQNPFSHALRRTLGRGLTTRALVILATCLSWAVLATPAQAAGPATSVVVTLAPTSIVANGTSQTIATATVTDASMNPVDLDMITFTSDSGNVVSTTTPTGNGTGKYTATITSTTTAGTPTITATDSSTTPTPISGTATLTQTPDPAVTMLPLHLSSSSIFADGTSQTTVTAKVNDGSSAGVSGELLAFTSSDLNEIVSATTDHHDGTYTATITSSTTVGTPTITATDSSVTPNLTRSATLTQTPGPATTVSVQLSSPAIIPDGISTSVATATVTDASSHRVPGNTVVFTSTDPGETVSATTDHNDGTYTATITSSTTVGTPTITATDSSVTPRVTGQAVLTQGSASSTTAMSVIPSSAVTNQVVTMFANVLSGDPTISPSGSISFVNGSRPIAGCGNVPVHSQGTVLCQTSFWAAPSPYVLTAVFTPTPGTSVAGSTSAADPLQVGKDGTKTSLQPLPAGVPVGSTVTYAATVTPNDSGPFLPTGNVAFFDGSSPIKLCSSQPVTTMAGGQTATCTVAYSTTGTHHISSQYSGNAKFKSSTSSPVNIVTNPLPLLGDVTSTMQWTFFYTPSYTTVVGFLVQNAPVGSTVVLQCQGHGCPFKRRATSVARPKPCHRKAGHKCPVVHVGLVDLVSRFHNHRLHIGARITVEILRPRYVGKYYMFQVRSRKGPRIQITCLAPGAVRPGVGC